MVHAALLESLVDSVEHDKGQLPYVIGPHSPRYVATSRPLPFFSLMTAYSVSIASDY